MNYTDPNHVGKDAKMTPTTNTTVDKKTTVGKSVKGRLISAHTPSTRKQRKEKPRKGD